MKRHSVDLITMGCSKNLVDSEHLLRQLEARGFRGYHNPGKTHGDIAVVNTCGFIGDAKEESVNMILELCQLKERGMLRKIYVMGCLSERYLAELGKELPQVDKFYGKFDWPGMLKELGSIYDERLHNERVLTTPPHYAYVKISEGCDRKCAYCAIPLSTGAHASRPEGEILDEVRRLVQQGVKEFQIIAQELTYYGLDLYHEQCLPELIDRMADIPGVEWIRLHYAYPAHFPTGLTAVMRRHPNICRYLDIALQHISDGVLGRMRRHTTKAETYELIRRLRDEVPGIAIRTTLMVGFPGETGKEFEELLDFVREVRFDRMGAFAYSEEEGTYAASHYADDVPAAVKQQRLDRLMNEQARISAELCGEKVGHTFRTIIDRTEGGFYVGRTQYDSPEVDGEVLIPRNGAALRIGQFYPVTIQHADEYDLYGTLADSDTDRP